MTRTRSTIWTLFTAILVLRTTVGPVMARNDTIAGSGDAAPGTSDTFTAFDDSVINDDGKVGFFARTIGQRTIHEALPQRAGGARETVHYEAESRNDSIGAAFYDRDCPDGPSDVSFR